MGIIDDLDKIVIKESDDDYEERRMEIDRDEEDSVGVDEIMNHLENMERAVVFIDKLTTVQGDSNEAFDAEVSLRRAIDKLKDLSKKIYKEKSK